MTAYRFVTLTCDGCGEIWDDGRSFSAFDARITSGRAGWTSAPNSDSAIRLRLDFCGPCTQSRAKQ